MSQIGVVIPTYNRVSALLTCLRHLEGQSFGDFEVVVVDDGSTDGTEQAMATYRKTSPLRLRYVRQENAGPARARNRAIAMLEAPVCLMIGDDIFADRELVAIHLHFHQGNPEERMVGLGWTRWSHTGQVVTPFMRWLETGGVQFSYEDLLRGVAPDWQHFYTSNLSLKTKLLRAHPFEEAFTKGRWMMEDLELGYRLERRVGMKLVFLPEASATHVHPTTFRKSCRRAFDSGVSAQVFHRLWPELRPQSTAVLRRWASGWVRRNPWVLRGLTWLTDRMTRVWCPNPLLRPVLALHAAAGYRREEAAGVEGVPAGPRVAG